MIEVESKYLVVDLHSFERAVRLWSHDSVPVEFKQCDEYFNHPCRDFGQTDEALRIRSCNDATKVTYKGPRLDAVTKTREELELEIPEQFDRSSLEIVRSMLLALGFTPSGCVQKTRRSFCGIESHFPVTVSVDAVEGLPVYAEIEITCDASQRPIATQLVLQLATSFGLTQSERRSYLELLGH